MPRKAKQKAKVPWYKRWKALILGAGALAVAILGVINLWDRIFPPPDEDIARIESVNIIKRTALTDFAPAGLGELLPLTPVPAAAKGLGADLRVDRDGAAQPDFTGLHQATPGPQPTFTTTTPTPTRTISPSPTVTSTTISPSPTDSTTAPVSPTPSPTPSETKVRIPKPLTGDLKESIREQQVLSRYARDATHHALQALRIEPVDDTGASLPPVKLAEELAEALEDVEATSGPEGEDPQGWTIAVRVDLEGLANVPLLLTWSLDGLDVPLTWQAENLAYRVVGATPHDAGVAEIWVPDLKRPGSYNVNIKLSYESSGLVADLRPLAVPDTGVIQGGG